MFTEAQNAALIQHEQVYGHGRHAAKLALKLAAFRYPGAPKRSIGSIAHKLWTIYVKRTSNVVGPQPKTKRVITVGGEADGVVPASRPFRFEGSFEGDEFRFTIIGKMEHLKAFISKFS